MIDFLPCGRFSNQKCCLLLSRLFHSLATLLSVVNRAPLVHQRLHRFDGLNVVKRIVNRKSGRVLRSTLISGTWRRSRDERVEVVVEIVQEVPEQIPGPLRNPAPTAAPRDIRVVVSGKSK